MESELEHHSLSEESKKKKTWGTLNISKSLGHYRMSYVC